MYLLEYVHRALTREKLPVALKLMHTPWECTEQVLPGDLPPRFRQLFLQVAGICSDALLRKRRRSALVDTPIEDVALSAYAELAGGARLPLGHLAEFSAEQLAGQIREDLKRIGASYDTLGGPEQDAFVLLYGLAEAALQVLCGIAVPSGDGTTFHLTREQSFLDGLRLYWFGHHWSYQSQVSDLLMRQRVRDTALRAHGSLEAAVREGAPVFAAFFHASLDKYLSIHHDFTHRLPRAEQAIYASVYRRAELICYLYLKSMHDGSDQYANGFDPARDTVLPGTLDIADIGAAGFTPAEIESLLEISAALPPGEQLLVRAGAARLSLGNLNLKYACNVYFKDALARMPARGDWFERDYIHRYLKEKVAGGRYFFGETVKPGNKEEAGYDIDLVVADSALERIYLCQIKHRTATVLPYLRDELKEYSTNPALATAVRQLTEARPHLTSPKFVGKVRDSLRRGGAPRALLAKMKGDFLARHHGLIILHTIENLDFALKDGIALYEWNTFRNMLKGTLPRVAAGPTEPGPLRLSEVHLDNPLAVSDSLLETLRTHAPAAYAEVDSQWRLKASSYLQLTPRRALRLRGNAMIRWRARSVRYPLL